MQGLWQWPASCLPAGHIHTVRIIRKTEDYAPIGKRLDVLPDIQTLQDRRNPLAFAPMFCDIFIQRIGRITQNPEIRQRRYLCIPHNRTLNIDNVQ